MASYHIVSYYSMAGNGSGTTGNPCHVCVEILQATCKIIFAALALYLVFPSYQLNLFMDGPVQIPSKPHTFSL